MKEKQYLVLPVFNHSSNSLFKEWKAELSATFRLFHLFNKGLWSTAQSKVVLNAWD